MTPPSGKNPYYPLLMIVGALFTITACAYGLRTYLALRPPTEATLAATSNPLMQFIDQHGVKLLLGEVAALAGLAVAAMMKD